MNPEEQTNTFSEEGRIHQVEYAIRSISSAGPVIAIKSTEGIILLGKATENSLSLIKDDKIYRISKNTLGIVAGLYSDSNLLINYARIVSEEHFLKYNNQITAKQIGKHLSKIKQKYTQGGGIRPFGVSIMLAGFDENDEFILVSTDPSGTLVNVTGGVFGSGEKMMESELLSRDLVSDELLGRSDAEAAISKGRNTISDELRKDLILGFKGLCAGSEGGKVEASEVSCGIVTKINGEKVIRVLSQLEIAEYLEIVKTIRAKKAEDKKVEDG